MKTTTFVGGIIGLVTFLCVGLLPSLVYGGFAGAVISSSIYGPLMQPNLIQRGLVVGGMLVGLLSTAGLFVVVGAALTSLAGLAFESARHHGEAAKEQA
jgi:hypothetical protein